MGAVPISSLPHNRHLQPQMTVLFLLDSLADSGSWPTENSPGRSLVPPGPLVTLAGDMGIGKPRTVQKPACQAEALRARVKPLGLVLRGSGASANWPWVQRLRCYVLQMEAEKVASEIGPGTDVISERLLQS